MLRYRHAAYMQTRALQNQIDFQPEESSIRNLDVGIGIDHT